MILEPDKHQLEEFVNLLEEDIESNGDIPVEYLKYLDKNFPKEFITLVLNAVGILKLKKKEFNIAIKIFNRTLENYDNKNPYLYTSLAITYLESIPKEPELDKINRNKVFAAKKNIDLANKYIKEEPDSYAKQKYLLIINDYLSYFNYSFESIFKKIDFIILGFGNTVNLDKSKKEVKKYIFKGEVSKSQFGDGSTQYNAGDLSNKQSLSEAAIEIQNLLKQLEETNANATHDDKVAYINKQITPDLKSRVVGALQASSNTAIDEFILENKYLKVAKSAIEGWLKPGN